MFSLIFPKLILLISAVVILLASLIPAGKKKTYLAYMTLTGLVVAFFFSVKLIGEKASIFSGMLRVDALSTCIEVLIIGIGIVVVLGSVDTLSRNTNQGEYYVLILFSILGATLMAASSNLLFLFLGLELTTLPCFVLVGFKKKSPKASEASLKYVILALFASAFVLYGFSFIYGTTGSLDFFKISSFFKEGILSYPYILVAILFVIFGFGFKVAVFPFHFWVPDAYEASIPQVAGYLSAIPKAGGFAALIRLFAIVLPYFSSWWIPVFGAVALFSMTFGNLVAYAQTNIKRMLAYSSIAHAGYIMVGLAVGTRLAFSSMIFYVFVYALANLGGFFVIAACSKFGDEIKDFAGLSRRAPFLAFSMSIFLLSLAGIPPLAGFMGKLYIFGVAVKEGVIWLAVVGVLNSVVSLGYYSSVIREMYLVDTDKSSSFAVSKLLLSSIALLLGLVFVAGIYPSPFMSVLKLVF